MANSDSRQLARLNALYTRVFQRPIDMSTFDRRMQLQKFVYILQSEGIDLDYDFTWYLRGPYSSRLADDGYDFVRRGSPGAPQYNPTAQEEEVIAKLLRAGDLVQDSINAELIASHLYLQRRYEDGASEELRTRKPRFSLHYISQVMQRWQRLD